MVIVYIDDDTEDIAFFSDALSKVDPRIELVTTTGPKDGLRLLSVLRPDYIFLDLNMPELSGKEVLRLIVANEHLKNIPVVMFSTSIPDSERTVLINNGAAECMIKPDSLEVLYRNLSEFFKR